MPSQYPDDPTGPSADWNSPLWGEPQTVATGYRGAPPETPAVFRPVPPPPPPPHRRSRALLLSMAAAITVIALLGAFLVHGALGRNATTAAPSPTPSISAPTPVVPSPTPTTPSETTPSLIPPVEQDPNEQDPNAQDPNAQDPSQQDPSQQDPTAKTPALTAKQKAIVAAVSPGLVNIVTTIGYDGSEGAGTGEVLTSDGLILTNHHVIAGSTSISVTDIANGKTYKAKVVGYDSTHDIAVIKLVDASGLATAPLGNSSTVAVGDSVVGLGNAGGKGTAPTPAVGTVTGLDQPITATDSSDGTSEHLTGLIETDAPIQPGDSGGSLISADAKVVGIITAGSTSGSGPMVRAAGDGETSTDGYAIPINKARSIADQIIAGKSSSTIHLGGSAFLGVQVADDSNVSSARGVVVAGTVPGSAAAKAGLTAGDVVTAIDGKSVTDGDALKAALASHHAGDSITVGWTNQSGKSHSTRVTLGAGPVG
jgi:S1-C subfamily serine protease